MKMNTMNSCDIIRQSLVKSGLHFFVNESPYSLWITVRKKFMDNNQNLIAENTDEASVSEERKMAELENEMKDLKEKYSKISVAFEAVTADFELEISEHKGTIEENRRLRSESSKKDSDIMKLKQEAKHLENELKTSEIDLKKAHKEIKSKEKEVHDLKKERVKVKEDLDRLNTEHTEFKVNVNKERKEHCRKLKKQEKKDFMNNLKSESNPLEINCEMCGKMLSSLEKFKAHVLANHTSQSETQTNETIKEDKYIQTNATIDPKCDKELKTFKGTLEEAKENLGFEKYSCYYCGKIISNFEFLQVHRKNCHGGHSAFGTANCVKPERFDHKPIGFPSTTFFPFPPGLSSFLPGKTSFY